jgi:hypothetical protein
VAPAARDLVVVDASVVRLLLEGLGLTSALDGRDCLRAVDGRLSAPRLLARGSVRGVLPRSTARDLRLAYPVDPSYSGGGCDEVIRSCSRFSSRAPFSLFFSADVAKATAPAAPPTLASI